MVAKEVIISPAKAPLKGEICPPADKSISHRSVMIASITEGRSVIQNFLQADDCLSTLNVCRSLGVQADFQADGALRIAGLGLRGFKQPSSVLDAGNSGSTLRMMLGLLSGQSFISTLAGDESLGKRPMKRVVTPLREMGAKIQGPENGNFAPITVRGGHLKGISYLNELGSAQVKSALLFAGLFAEGATTVTEPRASRDHTERMLKMVGAPLKVEGQVTTIQKAEKLNPLEILVPADISSAAFFMVAASIVPGSELCLRNVGINPTRSGIVECLRQMGADIEVMNSRDQGEPTADLLVRSHKLKGIKIGRDQIPSVIDELPLIMVAASLAEGVTEISGAEELRVKETDRISAMVENLKILGVDIEEKKDGCRIQGREIFSGGTVKSFEDHRIAMCMAVAGLHASQSVKIMGADAVRISYPLFFQDLQRLSC